MTEVAHAEWLLALTEADSVPKLMALWKSLTVGTNAPWGKFTGEQQVSLMMGKDKRKVALQEAEPQKTLV